MSSKNKSISKSVSLLANKSAISLSDICQDKRLYKKTYPELDEENRLFYFNDIKKFVDHFSIIGGSVIAGNCFYHGKKERVITYYIYKNHPRTLEKILAKIGKGYVHTKKSICFKKEYACKILLIEAKSISDIVFSFNSGPDQIAYDGLYFYFSAVALLTCYTGHIIANPSNAKTPNYVQDLSTYILHGFIVLFPHGNFALTKDKNELKVNELFSPYFAYLGNQFIVIKYGSTKDMSYTESMLSVDEDHEDYLFIKELLHGNGDFGFTDNKISPMPEVNELVLLLMGILDNNTVYNKNYICKQIKELKTTVKRAYNSYQINYTWQKGFDSFSISNHEWYGQYYTPVWKIPTSSINRGIEKTSQGTEKTNQEVEYLIYNILIKYFPNDIVCYIIYFANEGHMATKPSLTFNKGKISLIKPFWHDYNYRETEDHIKNVEDTCYSEDSFKTTSSDNSDSTDSEESPRKPPVLKKKLSMAPRRKHLSSSSDSSSGSSGMAKTIKKNYTSESSD